MGRPYFMGSLQLLLELQQIQLQQQNVILKAKDIHQEVSLTKIIASKSACKKSVQFITSFSRYRRFQCLMNLLVTPTQKSFKLLDCVSLHAWCKKSVHSINSFQRYSQFQSPVTRLITPIFEHAHPKVFQSSFNLCEFALTFFLEIWLFQKSYLVGLEHFGPNLRNLNFPKYGICAGTQQII